MAQWTKRKYSKGEIDRAGDSLVPWWSAPANDPFRPDDLGQLYMIVQNWRTSHALPLNVIQASLRARAKRVDSDVIVAQRLKRFSSLMNKLVRESTMKLSQMQDLGGCRAIVSDVRAVDRLFDMYRGGASLFESLGQLKCYDYIRNPKADGYRGIHVVARYRPRLNSREDWNGHRIEIQLRSRLQHAFATTVETVTTFTRTRLKFGEGPVEWRRFFSLTGSALAVREGTPLVEGTPLNDKELIAELREASRELKVRDRLQGWTDALRTSRRQNIRRFKWLLLVLDIAQNKISVMGYENRLAADKRIAEIERMKRDDLDAVLVWVNSLALLRKAYPNYYADAREFLKALDLALARK